MLKKAVTKMNRMESVAKLFGLKLNEEFKIKGDGLIYKFTEDGIKCSGAIENGSVSDGNWFAPPTRTLDFLLQGEYTIQAYIPKYGKSYYYVSADGTIIRKVFEVNTLDLLNVSIGNCFRDKDIVSESRISVIAQMYSEYRPQKGAELICSILTGDAENDI